MGIGILMLGVFIIMGGIQMVLVAFLGLAVIGIFVMASMAVSSVVFRICDHGAK